mgnify:CR=1 FL=1
MPTKNTNTKLDVKKTPPPPPPKDKDTPKEERAKRLIGGPGDVQVKKGTTTIL